MLYFKKRQTGGIQMKKRILPILLITVAVAALIAYKGDEGQSQQ